MPSVAFAMFAQARLPFGRPNGREHLRRCRLRFMLRTGQLLHPASHPGLSTDAGGFTTGDPGVSPDRTHTGWLTRAC